APTLWAVWAAPPVIASTPQALSTPSIGPSPSTASPASSVQDAGTRFRGSATMRSSSSVPVCKLQAKTSIPDLTHNDGVIVDIQNNIGEIAIDPREHRTIRW